jgi:SAM-dependent methyltransferase
MTHNNHNAIKAAIDGAYQFMEQQQSALDNNEITEQQWFNNRKEYITSHYLKADNPRAQSGHSGDEQRYRYTQGMILEAIYRNGKFIDIGCANGYLLEKIDQWLINLGIKLTFYGLDISTELLSIAKQRLPKLSNNLFLGNALYWNPPFQFDYVCIRELDYVPRDKRKCLFSHLYNNLLSDGGRLILGPYTEEIDKSIYLTIIQELGIFPTGYCIKSHQEYKELCRKLYWFDK